MTTSSGKVVGIDVAKEKFDIAMLGKKKASQVGNDEGGITKLVKKLQVLEPELIVVEATGGYHRMYAEVPDDLECNDARQSPVQAEAHCLRPTDFPS